jgi:hypothetical protein
MNQEPIKKERKIRIMGEMERKKERRGGGVPDAADTADTARWDDEWSLSAERGGKKGN